MRARLAAEGLAPSPEADRATLARRLSLDLRGLPPTPAELDAFLADEAPDAYERLVERFLADPAYAERRASSWLDLARYADTKGYEKDDRRTIWPWRDWVVRAFDADLPFDVFTLQQLAGDLLSDATDETRLATAFHRNTMTNDEGGTDDEEFRAAAVADRVDTTMQAWMGLTAGCARCHDHKFDPLSQQEYFGLYAVFDQTADTDRPDDAPLLEAPDAHQRTQLEALERRRADVAERLLRRERELEDRREVWLERLEGRATLPLDQRLALDGAERLGTPAREPGVIGPALTLDGVRALVLSDAGDFEHDQPFSCALWLRRDGDGVHVPVGRIDAGADYRGWDLYLHRGKAYVHLIDEWPDECITVEARVLVPAGVWTHVAVTYDGSGTGAGVRLYLDGRLAETRVTHDSLGPESSIRTPRALLVGRRHGEEADGQGAVDDLRLVPRVLRDDELARIVEHGVLAAAERPEHGQLVARHLRLADDAWLAAEDERLALERELADVRAGVPSVPVLAALPADQRRTTRVHLGGNFLARGPAVRPGVPAVFADVPVADDVDRLALARWLVAPENPLTARVQVNRLWSELFGTGLVTTPEDFGKQGERPSHPALLDWLAVEFVESGWSWKALCRAIVTSRTYRQSSVARADGLARDPRNRLLWRGPRHRLPAEIVRDQALALGGLLNRQRFGPPVFPPQPEGVWQVVYSGDSWVDAQGPDRWRRALYTFWRRTSPYPSLVVFDAPSREVCVSRRVRTNTPLQALVTLNDPAFVEAAQGLARRVLRETDGDDARRAAAAFRWCTGRAPSTEERDALVALVRSERAHYATTPEEARRLAGLGDDAAVDAVELAAWTVAANVLLNLDEVLVKG